MHEKFMNRCLELAQKGAGFVSPNPMVGSVIVHQGKIIGEGFHEQYGMAHAEVNAINSVKNPELLTESTIYVNLEPCAHFGKTPPCSDLIIAKKIPHVVVGCIDSYAQVAGKGIEKMKKAGCHVEVGALEKECLDLNRRFFTFHNQQRPYVILKWAESKDGFIDIDRQGQKGVHWISHPNTKKLTHQWRHEEDAILVGRKTVETDNPSLTCREYKGKNPIRIVIDKDMRLDYGAFAVGDHQQLTYILTRKKIQGSNQLQFLNPQGFEIKNILELLYEKGIQSVIIEGGAETLQRFIAANLWDEARIITGVAPINKGKIAPTLKGTKTKSFTYGEDQISIYYND